MSLNFQFAASTIYYPYISRNYIAKIAPSLQIVPSALEMIFYFFWMKHAVQRVLSLLYPVIKKRENGFLIMCWHHILGDNYLFRSWKQIKIYFRGCRKRCHNYFPAVNADAHNLSSFRFHKNYDFPFLYFSLLEKPYEA